MKKLLPIVLIFVVVAGIAWFLSGQYLPKIAPPSEQPPPVQKEQVKIKLSLVPEATTIQVGEQTTVNIVADTGTLGLSGVQSSLNYDPEYLKVIEIVEGPFLTDPTSLVETIDPINGLISYALASLEYSQGNGVVYSIVVEAVKPTNEATLTFDRQTTKPGLENMAENKRYAEDEVSVEFSEQSFSILP